MATPLERIEQLINLQGHALGVLRELTSHVARIAARLNAGAVTGSGAERAPRAAATASRSAGGGGGPGWLGRISAMLTRAGAWLSRFGTAEKSAPGGGRGTGARSGAGGQSDRLVNLQGQALGALRGIASHVAAIASRLRAARPAPSQGRTPSGSAGRATPVGGKPPGGAAGGVEGLGGLGRIAGTLGGALARVGAVLGVAAVGIAAIVGAVAGAVAALSAIPTAAFAAATAAAHFVSALNPGLVERYHAEWKNFSATIGYGLTPVIAYATRTVKEWAGLLLPSIQKLRPIVEGISAAMSGLMSGAGRMLARAAEGAVAILARFQPVIESVIESFGMLYEIGAAVIDVLNTFDGGMSELLRMAGLGADGLRRMVMALAVASAKLLGAFGGADSLNRFRDSIRRAIAERRDPARGLLAAPTDSGVTGIEDIGKKLSAAAYIAGAGGDTRAPDVRALESILAEIEGIEPTNWQKMITEAVREGVRGAINNPGEGLRRGVDLIRADDPSTTGAPRSRGRAAVDRAAGVGGFFANPIGSIAGLFGG